MIDLFGRVREGMSRSFLTPASSGHVSNAAGVIARWLIDDTAALTIDLRHTDPIRRAGIWCSAFRFSLCTPYIFYTLIKQNTIKAQEHIGLICNHTR